MKALLVLVVLAGHAYADARGDVGALVRKSVAAIAASDDKAFAATLRDDVTKILPRGQGEMESLAETFYGRRVSGVRHAPQFSIAMRDEVAWFHGAIDAEYRFEHIGITPQPVTKRWLLTGVAIKEGTWKIAALMIAERFDAADLTFTPEPMVPRNPLRQSLLALFESWRVNRVLSRHAAATAVVSGPRDVRAPDEWPLRPISARAWVWQDTAFVKAHVMWKDTAMVLGAILVRQGGEWRWTVLALAADSDG